MGINGRVLWLCISDHFKMYTSDTELFITLAFKNKGYTENIIYEKLLNNELSTNLGYVYENMIAQMLRTTGKELITTQSQRTRERSITRWISSSPTTSRLRPSK